jgi:multiple sugar transport system permease protein
MSTAITLPGEPVQIKTWSLAKVTTNALLVLCGLFFLLPMIWLATACFDAAASERLKWPSWTLAQFAIALDPDNLGALVNSLILSLVATVVATVPSAIAAYSFSRHKLPGKQAILLAILFLSGVPISILIIPIYQLFQWADCLTLLPTAVFLGVTAIPFEIHIIKNSIDAIPLDLEEAARIERAGIVRILVRVIAPLCLPGIMAAAIYGFVNTWGNFLPPLVLITDSDQQPSPVAIFSLMSNNVVNYGGIAAYSLVYSVPVVVLYVLLARFFKGGFALGGAVK